MVQIRIFSCYFLTFYYKQQHFMGLFVSLYLLLIRLPTFLPNVWIKNFQQGQKLKLNMLVRDVIL